MGDLIFGVSQSGKRRDGKGKVDSTALVVWKAWMEFSDFNSIFERRLKPKAGVMEFGFPRIVCVLDGSCDWYHVVNVQGVKSRWIL